MVPANDATAGSIDGHNVRAENASYAGRCRRQRDKVGGHDVALNRAYELSVCRVVIENPQTGPIVVTQGSIRLLRSRAHTIERISFENN